MQVLSNPPGSPLKVVLVTSFVESHLQQDTLPELARRGVEVVARFEAKESPKYDFNRFKEQGVSLILHMHEVGPHPGSELLSRAARAADLPIKALSRKKASWTFLPAPLDGNPPSSDANPPSGPVVESRRGLGHHSGTITAALGADAVFEAEKAYYALGEGYLHADPLAAGVPPHVEKFLVETRFDRKTARLRDVVQLVLGHGITDPEKVIGAVQAGREKGVFPRLLRLKKDEIPKLVRGILEQEMTGDKLVHLRLNQSDAEEFQSIGLTEPNTSTREEAVMTAQVISMAKDEVGKMREELAAMKAQQAEYEVIVGQMTKLKEAHAALRKLVQLGMMSPVEAAERLFKEPLE